MTVGRPDGAYTARIELSDLALVGVVEARDGNLYIANAHGAIVAPLDEFEALYAEPPLEVEIRVETTYPLREPNAREPGRVAWLFGDEALVNVRRTQLRLDHRQYGLEKGMDVAFVDELAPGKWAALDVPGRSRQTLIEPLEPYTVTAAVVKRKVRKLAVPAVGVVARTDEIMRLIGEIAVHDNDHDRSVLVDLLADRGEPCAKIFAQLRGGDPLTPAKQKIALGPLAAMLKPVAFRHGLPHSAALMTKPDRDQLAAVVEDARLAMLEGFRLGRGSADLYAAILRRGNMISLRRADAPSAEILQALRTYPHLTHLYDVRFSQPVAVALLADPVFDTVRELELPIEHRFAGALMERLIQNEHVFAVQRHLTFIERNRNTLALAEVVFSRFSSLHDAIVSIGGVTLENVDGRPRATLARDADLYVVQMLRAMMPGA